nr:unnamed protein product [Spirometra erinaceieuropaei]
MSDEVFHWTSRVSETFDWLLNSKRYRHDIHLHTKLRVNEAVILTTLLWGADTWMVYSSHPRKFSHFHLGRFRRIVASENEVWGIALPPGRFFSKGFPNLVRRFREKFFIVAPPFIITYMILQWAGNENARTKRKAYHQH